MPWRQPAVERAAPTALPDVGAVALSLPASGLQRQPYRSHPVDVAEEVEQNRVLGARRVAACRSGQRADRGPRRRRRRRWSRSRGNLAAASSKIS